MADKITKVEKELGLIAFESDRVGGKSKEAVLADYGEHPEAYCPVNYEDRSKFLKDNGHPVTRANLTDGSLSVRRKK